MKELVREENNSHLMRYLLSITEITLALMVNIKELTIIDIGDSPGIHFEIKHKDLTICKLLTIGSVDNLILNFYVLHSDVGKFLLGKNYFDVSLTINNGLSFLFGGLGDDYSKIISEKLTKLYLQDVFWIEVIKYIRENATVQR